MSLFTYKDLILWRFEERKLEHSVVRFQKSQPKKRFPDEHELALLKIFNQTPIDFEAATKLVQKNNIDIHNFYYFNEYLFEGRKNSSLHPFVFFFEQITDEKFKSKLIKHLIKILHASFYTLSHHISFYQTSLATLNLDYAEERKTALINEERLTRLDELVTEGYFLTDFIFDIIRSEKLLLNALKFDCSSIMHPAEKYFWTLSAANLRFDDKWIASFDNYQKSDLDSEQLYFIENLKTQVINNTLKNSVKKITRKPQQKAQTSNPDSSSTKPTIPAKLTRRI